MTHKSDFVRMATASLLVVMLWSAGNSHADLGTGLLALYSFDGNGKDSSGNDRDLNLVGSPGFAAGKFGQALDLHGNGNQYAVRPVDDTAFNFGSKDFTIQLWVNFNTVDHVQTMMEKFSDCCGPGWTMTTDLAGTVYQFYAGSRGDVHLNSSFSPAAGVWHDLVARSSGTSFDLYVDGALAASAIYSAALDSSSMPLLIGRRNSDDGRDFSVDGRIDDVAIWNRALSATEIATLWDGGAGTPVVSTIPEPETYAMLLAGLGLLGFLARRGTESIV